MNTASLQFPITAIDTIVSPFGGMEKYDAA